jgi:hypothetical protein
LGTSCNTAVLESFQDRLITATENGRQAVHALENLRGVTFPLRTRSFGEFCTDFCHKEGLNESFLDEMLKGAETHADVYGFINGLTHASKLLLPTRRHRVETMAGSLVFGTDKTFTGMVRKY